MYWQEHDQSDNRNIPDDIQDLSYRLQANTLPLDHALALSDAILDKLPWLRDEPEAGIHLINYPESGNGWQRPADTPGEFVHLSGRTRLTLRLPKHRLQDAHNLTGQSLDIAGHSIAVGKANSRLLAVTSTLIARRVVINGRESEQEFVERCVGELGNSGVQIRKILCGRLHQLQLSSQPLPVRSVMIADLTTEESFQLQRSGLGWGRLTGCGLFVPHKGITSTTESR
jgi:CRISPR-associated protein Cas6